jgi:predicted Zn-dependent protease
MDAGDRLMKGFSREALTVDWANCIQAPRMLGGDRQKAVDYLEKGLRFGKDNALLRLRLAEAYHQVNRDADALKQIDYLLSMKAEAAFAAEHKEAVEKAQKLRSELRV